MNGVQQKQWHDAPLQRGPACDLTMGDLMWITEGMQHEPAGHRLHWDVSACAWILQSAANHWRIQFDNTLAVGVWGFGVGFFEATLKDSTSVISQSSWHHFHCTPHTVPDISRWLSPGFGIILPQKWQVEFSGPAQGRWVRRWANLSRKTLIDQVIRAPCLECTSLELN